MAYDLGRSEGLIRIVYDSEGVAHAEADLTDLDETIKKLGQAAARINIDILDEDAKRELEALQRRIELLAVNVANPEINISDEQAMRAIEQISLQLHALDAQSTQVDFEVNADAVVKEIAQIESEIETLQGMADDVNVDIDTREADAAIKELAAKLKALEAVRTKLEINIDDKETQRELDDLQQELFDLDKSTTHIGIELDKARADAQFKELDKQITKLQKEVVTIKLDPDTEKAQEDLREVAIKLDLIARKRADAKIGLDGVPATLAELAAITAELDRLDGREVDPRIGKKAMSQYAEFRENLFSILQLAAAFAPALIPVAAVVTQIAAGATAAFATLGTGIAVFAGAAVADLKGVAGALKLIKQSQDKYNKALATGDQKAQLQAINESIGAMKQLSPAEQLVAMGFLKLKEAWSNMAASIKPQVLEVAYRVMGALSSVIDRLAPLMGVVGQVAVDTAKKFQEFANSKEVVRFLNDVTDAFTQVGENAGDTFFNVLTSILNILHQLMPLGVEFSNVIARLSDHFKSFTGSDKFAQGLQDFFQYAQQVAPNVESFILALGEALVAVGKAGAPLGPVLLDILTTLLKVVAAVANSPFGPWIVGLASITLASKSLFGPISSLITGIHEFSIGISALKGSQKAFEGLSESSQKLVTAIRGGVSVTKKMATAIADGAKAALDYARNMAAIVRANVASALSSIADKAKLMAKALKDAALAAKAQAVAGLTALRTALIAIIPEVVAFIVAWGPWLLLAAAIVAAIYLVYRNWDTIWNAIKKIFDAVVNFIKDHWKQLIALLPGIGPILFLIVNYWRTAFNLIQTIVRTVINIVMTIIRTAMAVIQAVISTALNVISAVWNAVWNAILAVATFIWNAIRGFIQGAINAILAIVQFATGVIQAVWNAALNAMLAVARFIWGAIQGTIQGAINVIMGAVSTVTRIAGIFIGAMGDAARAVSNGIATIVGFFSGLFGQIVGAIGDAGSWLFGIGQDIVNGLIQGIGSLAGAVTDALLSLIPGPLKRFAKRLGIGSPSKVFHGFGVNIVEGLNNGIMSQQMDLSKTVDNVLKTAVPIVNAGDLAATINGSSGGSSTPVNQTFNFQFGDIAGGPEVAATIQAAVTSPDVIGQLMAAARSGVRGGV